MSYHTNYTLQIILIQSYSKSGNTAKKEKIQSFSGCMYFFPVSICVSHFLQPTHPPVFSFYANRKNRTIYWTTPNLILELTGF